MNIFHYLDKYQDVLIKESPLNELDGAIFSLLAYLNYNEFGVHLKPIKAKKLLQKVEGYNTYPLSKQYLKYFDLLKLVLKAKRFTDLKIAHFASHSDPDSIKQFQAVTFIIKKQMIVSFSGTDHTLLGWKEDANMSLLEITPGEIEAEHYLKRVSKKHPFKKIIVVGHSKGGRFAVTAAKDFHKKNKLLEVYSFDAPNNKEEFYNEEYKKIEPIVQRFAPEKSIVGRLISEPKNCQIVKSTSKFIWAHDLLSWQIEENHFAYAKEYSKMYSKMVQIVNDAFTKYSNEEKKGFVDAIFKIAEHFSGDEDAKLTKMQLVKTVLGIAVAFKPTVKSLIKVLLEIVIACL